MRDERTLSPDEVIDWIEQWYVDLDKGIVTMFEGYAKNQDAREISCNTCPHKEPGCCNQKTMISFMEALPIARHIMRSGLDSPAYRAKLRAIGEAMEGSSRDGWFDELHPCVFLEGGRCSIYALRPVSCRSYWVVTPPEDCQELGGKKVAFIDNGEILTRAFQQSTAFHKTIGLKENEQRFLMGAMPRLVWIALEAWDLDDPIKFIRSQIWPSVAGLDRGWVDGANPFDRLVQIRPRPPQAP